MGEPTSSSKESGSWRSLVGGLFARKVSIEAVAAGVVIGSATPQDLPASGVLGTGDNTVIYTSPAGIQEYDIFEFQQLQAAAQVSVQVKTTNADSAWSADINILDFLAVNPGGARVLTTAAGNTGRYAILGKFYQLRILQNGATAANIEGVHRASNAGV